MLLEFTKMHGLGNDYIYINCLDHEYKSIYKHISEICDRHFGIGADGVILICRSTVADFKMRIFNADGSEAEMCGNGIRCVGKYLYDKKYTKKLELNIETLCGIKKLKLEVKDGKVSNILVDMGEPLQDTEVNNCALDIQTKSQITIKIDDEDIILNNVSMGNPHAVTIVKNIDKININKYGPIIEKDKNFPRRTNVEFVEILDENNIKIRVWERGSNETFACGTGACASVVSCCKNNLTNRLVNVYLLGGVLTVYWNETDNHVYMKGPASVVFEGQIEI